MSLTPEMLAHMIAKMDRILFNSIGKINVSEHQKAFNALMTYGESMTMIGPDGTVKFIPSSVYRLPIMKITKSRNKREGRYAGYWIQHLRYKCDKDMGMCMRNTLAAHAKGIKFQGLMP